MAKPTEAELGKVLDTDAGFRYRLLSRMQDDCVYALHANSNKHLWASGDPEKQIAYIYAYNEMPSGSMFVVAESSQKAGVKECEDLPIVMRQSIVQKITVAHDLSLADLRNLPTWLKDYPLALESLSDINSIVLITDAKDIHGNEILIALHLEKEYQNLELNEISSIYGKKNLAYLTENTFAAGKSIYVNERTGNWLQLAGLPLPELVANYLSNEIIALNGESINSKGTKTCDSPGLFSKEAEAREALNALSKNRTIHDAINKDNLSI